MYILPPTNGLHVGSWNTYHIIIMVCIYVTTLNLLALRGRYLMYLVEENLKKGREGGEAASKYVP